MSCVRIAVRRSFQATSGQDPAIDARARWQHRERALRRRRIVEVHHGVAVTGLLIPRRVAARDDGSVGRPSRRRQPLRCACADATIRCAPTEPTIFAPRSSGAPVAIRPMPPPYHDPSVTPPRSVRFASLRSVGGTLPQPRTVPVSRTVPMWRSLSEPRRGRSRAAGFRAPGSAWSPPSPRQSAPWAPSPGCGDGAPRELDAQYVFRRRKTLWRRPESNPAGRCRFRSVSIGFGRRFRR